MCGGECQRRGSDGQRSAEREAKREKGSAYVGVCVRVRVRVRACVCVTCGARSRGLCEFVGTRREGEEKEARGARCRRVQTMGAATGASKSENREQDGKEQYARWGFGSAPEQLGGGAPLEGAARAAARAPVQEPHL